MARSRVSAEFAQPPKPRPRQRAKDKDRSPRVRSVEDPAAAALRAMRMHIELGEVEAALAVYNKSSRSQSGWQPPERDWRDLIEAILDQSLWDEAVRVMRDYVRKLDEPSPRVRLKLAQILIQKLGRPVQAIRVLGQVPEGSLPDSLEAMRRQLVRQAEAMQEEGPLELEEEQG